VKTYESPYLADWFAILLRWLVIIGLAIAFALVGQFDHFVLGALALPVVWNVFMSILAIFNRRLAWHRFFNVAIDTLANVLIFIAGHEMHTTVLWTGILVIFSSAIYYELRGALFFALLITTLQCGYIYLLDNSGLALTNLAILGGLNITAGVVIGILSRPLIRRLRSSYQGVIHTRKELENRAQRAERERMKALFGMVETLSASLNYKTILETAMLNGITYLGVPQEAADKILCAFFLFEDSELCYTVGRGFPSRDQNIPLPAESGALHDALHDGEFKLVHDAASDPELGKLIALHSVSSVLCLPMIRALNAYGLLLYAHPTTDFFTPDRIELLSMVCNQAVVAIQNARLFQDLTAEKTRIVQSQEEAQKKLARDLHDGPTQSVSAIAMRVNIARKMMEHNPSSAASELVKIEDLARRTTQEIRHMLFTLRPLVLESDGLVAALNAMAEKMHDLYQQNVVLEVDPEVVEELDSSHQTVVFYLTEEAVNNARKYAEASKITVRLQYITNDRNMAGLEIVDNGKGFNVNEVLGNYEKRGSLGMVNLRERADLVNGLFKIESAPGKGTRIRVYIPLSEEAVDRLHQLG
jgi:signal transduction histidine kinase